MRDFSEDNITEAVLERVRGADDLRTRQISEALVRHLHAFVKEIEPTQTEWEEGIAFLTATGQMCSDTRQEFILLSDTLGASMLVDAINHRFAGNATETTVLGPFYVKEPPVYAFGADISNDEPGDPLLAEGIVRSNDGTPLKDAMIDTWHSDADGYYDVQKDDLDSLELRARFHTDEAGRYCFRSIVPAFYPIPDDGPVGKMLDAQGRHPYRPAHVHFMISAPGHETLVTHIFIDGDPYLDSDVVFGVKNSLIKALEPATLPNGRSGFRLGYDFTLARSGA